MRETLDTGVVAAALELFATQGFDQTSVEQIAKAAGISRSTFFRQFGGKDDVIFADHELVLDRLKAFLAEPHDDPWLAVCQSAEQVFEHFTRDSRLARRRYGVVRTVPALRDREIVAVFQYERLFDEYLRRALPGIDPTDAVGFSALTAAVHNHILRRMLRGAHVPLSDLRSALDRVRARYGVLPDTENTPTEEVVVAVFPRAMPSAEVARRLQRDLARPEPTAGTE